MMLVVERPHEKYESTIFVKTGTIIESTSIIIDDNIKILTAETGGALITSVYKPSSIPFQIPSLHNFKPGVVIGTSIVTV